MGKPDARQPRLTFEQSKKAPKPTEGDPTAPEPSAERSGGPFPMDDIKTMFMDLKQSIQGLDNKMDSLAERMDRISQKVECHDSKITALETRTSDIEDGYTDLTKQLKDMGDVIQQVQLKNADLEARSRRNNVRITGIPESTDIPNMEKYVEALARELFSTELSAMFLIERAHRTLAPRPQPGLPPRPIIARVLNYRDRDAILRGAREKGTLHYQGNKISIYPDYTTQVQNARREFQPAKKLFQQIGTRYALIYPAKLRVSQNGKPLFFTDAKAAMNHAKKMAAEHRKNAALEKAHQEHPLSDTD